VLQDLRQAYFRPVAPERAHSTRRTACNCRYFWHSSLAVAASPSSVTPRNQRVHSMFVTRGASVAAPNKNAVADSEIGSNQDNHLNSCKR
jgi:hypothetical protein